MAFHSLVITTWTLLGACANDGGSPSRPTPTPDETPTYYADIQPLVASACGDCHVEGGIGPFRLDTFEQLQPRAELALASIESGRMPPWMSDPACNSFEGERLLEAEQKDLFRRWVRGSTPLGDPTDAPPPAPPPAPFEATHVGRVPKGYLPNPMLPDDYRCFLLDFDFDEDVFLTGSLVVPDARALVHHVLVYAVGPDLVPELEAADAAEDGPGYTCFGDPLPTGGRRMGAAEAEVLPTQLGGWVPGAAPTMLDGHRAFRIEAGSKIVMQVHYNLLSAEPERDATEFAMVLTDEAPEFVMTTLPLPILDLRIPAGDPRVVHERVFRNWTDEPRVIRSVTGHMHLLGTRLRAELVDAAGAVASCVLDIPAWDFGWQQSYRLAPEHPVVLEPGEGIKLTCVHDNSAENQPVVNGEQVPPRDVTWGEGTLDEMCLLYITEESAFDAAAEDATCGEMAARCLDGCEGSGSCLLGCGAMDERCRSCALDAVVACGTSSCGLQLLQAQSCLESCGLDTFILGGDMARCMAAECPGRHAALAGCLDPLIASGACDEGLAECGITR